MNRRILTVAGLALVIIGVVAMRAVSSLSPAGEGVPTTRAAKGDIDITVYTLGELGPRRSMTRWWTSRPRWPARPLPGRGR